jgi:hypothetical protein
VFDVSGGLKGAHHALDRPLDGRVRREQMDLEVRSLRRDGATFL